MKKIKRKNTSPTLEGTMDHFASQSYGLEIHGPKRG